MVSKELDINRVVFIGRTFDEYMKMFDLSIESLQNKKLLDCPAGACSFTAIASQHGIDSTSADIVYFFEHQDLKQKGLLDIEHTANEIQKVKNNYIWKFFKDVESLKTTRLQALKDCSEHMKKTSEKYVAVELPSLPFADQAFDITLSAHFLFTYANRLNYKFHYDAIKELLRVTSQELRIFPLVDMSGNYYEHLQQLKDDLLADGYICEELPVTYEFQKNANQIMVIKKK
ncbi:class I SAM-dependent methyltransferase [Acinetobacter baumannii]|uniref:class I SAM-dependent methyltransferase n=1 Tax=Acinetobacter baumannii TaxID=470 RepID=UPI00208E9C9F|nr:class I SAM-dependent methyltransferase [Acinetobacter baumannii]